MQRLHDEGKIFYTKNGVARLKGFVDEADGMPAQTIWNDKAVQYVVSWGEEKLAYDTQKSEGLLKRIIEASSNEGDLMLDCFVGSGTTAAALDSADGGVCPTLCKVRQRGQRAGETQASVLSVY